MYVPEVSTTDEVRVLFTGSLPKGPVVTTKELTLTEGETTGARPSIGVVEVSDVACGRVDDALLTLVTEVGWPASGVLGGSRVVLRPLRPTHKFPAQGVTTVGVVSRTSPDVTRPRRRLHEWMES